MAEDFVGRNPGWIIARTYTEAREALAQGKKCLILSVEGSHGIHQAERLEHLYAKGVRIITILHLTNTEVGGTALQAPGKAIFLTPRQQLFCRNRDRNGVRTSCRGLSSHGENVARKMMDLGIWIDLAHASDLSIRKLIPLQKKRNIPILVTHGSVRSKFRYERGISEQVLKEMKISGGMFGLVPSPELLGHSGGTVSGLNAHVKILLSHLSANQITITVIQME